MGEHDQNISVKQVSYHGGKIIVIPEFESFNLVNGDDVILIDNADYARFDKGQ